MHLCQQSEVFVDYQQEAVLEHLFITCDTVWPAYIYIYQWMPSLLMQICRIKAETSAETIQHIPCPTWNVKTRLPDCTLVKSDWLTTLANTQESDYALLKLVSTMLVQRERSEILTKWTFGMVFIG